MKRIFLNTILLFLSSVSLFSNTLGKDFNTNFSKTTSTFFNDLITEDTFYVQTSDCLANANVCIDIPFADIGNYMLMEGGNTYSNGFVGCMDEITSTYDYAQLFGQGNFGPYQLNSWDVDGTEFSGIFANIPDLVDSMNLWNPAGNWILDIPNQTIIGGEGNITYEDMDVTVVSINSPSSIPVSSSSSLAGSAMNLSVGTHWIQVIDNGGGLVVDSFFVNVLCVETGIENFTLVEDSVHVFCFDNSELLGQASSTQILCPSNPGTPADFLLIGGNSCVEITAQLVGQDSACYVLCDNFGICDTTFLYVTVEPKPIIIALSWIVDTVLQILLIRFA